MTDPSHIRAFYDQHADAYAQHTREAQGSDAVEPIRDYICTRLPDGSAILAAGCGHGRDVDYFLANGHYALGVDIARALVTRVDGDAAQMSLPHLGLQTNTFRGVWCPSALSFFDEAAASATLAEFRRVLKPEGLVLLGVRVGETTTTTQLTRRGETIPYRQYTARDSIALLEDCGFTPIREQFIQRDDSRQFIVAATPTDSATGIELAASTTAADDE